MKKITILVLHLGYGGVEKSVSEMVNMLHNDYEIEILSTYQLYEQPPFPFPENVKIRYLLPNLIPNRKELKQAIQQHHFLKMLKEGFKSIRILYLRRKTMIRAIKECDSDVIISTRMMFSKWLSRYGMKNSLKISQEHNHHNDNTAYIENIVKSCKRIDYFMPVSKELADFYKNKIKNGYTKVNYIPHSLDIYPDEASDYQKKEIISVGRLSPEKGYLDLLDVFSDVHQKDPKVTLHIFGDGPQGDEVKRKKDSLHLESSVILHGFTKREEINQYLSHAQLYLMTSYSESFGLVLIEAQAFGLPCIAYSSAQGAHEIIEDGRNGFLIENRSKEEMVDKIMMLLNDSSAIVTLGKQARKNASRYRKEAVREQWLQFLEEAMSKGE